MTSICAKKKRKECDDLLNHINKIKVLIDQFSLFGFTYEKWRCYHDFALEFATLIRTLEHCLRDYADEGVDCGIRDDVFARNVQKEEERTPRCWNRNGIMSRQMKPSSYKNVKTWYNCGKPSHIVRFFITMQ